LQGDGKAALIGDSREQCIDIGGCCRRPVQPEGQLAMSAAMVAEQILHFKGHCWG
jgi:hypothetical protein